jgi:hypothetical protein
MRLPEITSSGCQLVAMHGNAKPHPHWGRLLIFLIKNENYWRARRDSNP